MRIGTAGDATDYYGTFYDDKLTAKEMSWSEIMGVHRQRHVGNPTDEKNDDYRQILSNHISELYEKLQNGDTEQKFQIGGQRFSIKEWDELLERFDTAEKALRELVEGEEQAATEKMENILDMNSFQKGYEGITAEEAERTQEIGIDMLVSETYRAVFPHDEKADSLDYTYIIAMDSQGIRCAKPNACEYEWKIEFTDEDQYQKAKEFMDWADTQMDNFLFASHDYFWQDYLSGNLDEDEFKTFLETTNNGIPNYGIGDAFEMHINESQVSWAQYMNKTRTLRPVENIAAILRQPIQLAATTSLNRVSNSLSIAAGASITVAGGYRLTVKPGGVEVSGGNENEEDWQNAQDMAGALATLLRNASGQMKNVGTNSDAINRWSDNVAKVLAYFGIDTSKDFTVNGAKYTRDDLGRIVLDTHNDELRIDLPFTKTNGTM